MYKGARDTIEITEMEIGEQVLNGERRKGKRERDQITTDLISTLSHTYRDTLVTPVHFYGFLPVFFFRD